MAKNSMTSATGPVATEPSLLPISGVIIPLYIIPPNTAWTTVANIAKKYTIIPIVAIFNPDWKHPDTWTVTD
jgi:hypothetical protein